MPVAVAALNLRGGSYINMGCSGSCVFCPNGLIDVNWHTLASWPLIKKKRIVEMPAIQLSAAEKVLALP
jgi:hypothetical protein